MIDTTVPDDLIPLSEAAALHPRSRPGKNVHAVTIYRKIRRGKLRGWRDDGGTGRWLVSRAEVLALVRLVETTPELEGRADRRRKVRSAQKELEEAGVRRPG